MTTTLVLVVSFLALWMLKPQVKDIIKYYTSPHSNKPKFKFFGINWENVFYVWMIHIVISVAINSVLPPRELSVNLETYVERDPYVFLIAVVLTILWEELTHRIIPWSVLYLARTRTRLPWKHAMEVINIAVAMGSSIWFGLIHLSNYTDINVWTYVSLTSQMVGGLCYWYVIEKEGPLAAIALHIGFSSLGLLPLLF